MVKTLRAIWKSSLFLKVKLKLDFMEVTNDLQLAFFDGEASHFYFVRNLDMESSFFLS